MNYLLTLLSLVAIASPLQAYADPHYYQCQVMGDAYIQSSGSLEVLHDSSRIDAKFTVIKSTGVVIGDVMDVLNGPKVIALGDEKNSYKVIWEQKAAGKNGAFVDYLNVDEFVKGKKKPFGFFSGGLLLTGICK
jgi:hypothetical protein